MKWLFSFSRLVPLAVVVVVGCSSGSGSTGASPSEPARSRTTAATDVARIDVSSLTGRILFTRAGGAFGDETVFVAHADGTHARRITSPDAHCCPRWAPDGQHIFMSANSPDGRITTGVVAASGGAVRTLALPEKGLNLQCADGDQSPVTHRLLCEGFSDSQPRLGGIYTADATGGHLVRITPCCGPQDDRAIGFSPQGQRVYIFRPISGYPSYGDALEGGLFVANADGSGLKQLTPRRLPVEPVGSAGARLSPDGKQLVFASNGALWTVHVDGSRVTQIFHDTAGRLAITPTWSPDGQFILFGLDPAGELGFERNPPSNGLYVIRSDGSDLTPVVVTNDFKREPDWTAS